MKGFGSSGSGNAGSMPRPPKRPKPTRVGSIVTQGSKAPVKAKC